MNQGKEGNKAKRLPSQTIAARVGEGPDFSDVVQLQEPEAIMFELGDTPASHKYRAILEGVPDGVSLILRDYPKERHRDQFVLETIGAAVDQRSE